MKIYCSFDEKDILTGWTPDEGCFTTNETFREIDISEDEFEVLQNSHPKCFKFENGILVDRKQEFIDEIKDIDLSFEEKKEKDKEKCLQLFAETLSDEQALLVPLVFDEWKVGIEYKIGKRLVYDNVLYKVLQNHTSQETWTPNTATSLYARLLSETIDDSIPEWQQPTGSTEAYMIGDKVTYNGQIYECTSDYNVYAPDVSGWMIVK